MDLYKELSIAYFIDGVLDSLIEFESQGLD